MTAQVRKRILFFGVLHEILVIVDEKYQCMGVFLYLYSCLGFKKVVVTGPRPLVVRQVALVVR